VELTVDFRTEKEVIVCHLEKTIQINWISSINHNDEEKITRLLPCVKAQSGSYQSTVHSYGNGTNPRQAQSVVRDSVLFAQSTTLNTAFDVAKNCNSISSTLLSFTDENNVVVLFRN
jgi:hypothetical protein